MNWATSHGASGGELRGVVGNRRFLQEGRWGKKIVSERKERIVPGKITHLPWSGRPGVFVRFIWGMERAHGPDDLTGADPKIPVTA